MKPVDALALNHVDAVMDLLDDRVVALDVQVEAIDLRVEPQANW